ncbi:hypothetical protein [Roseomonas sp. AR75]|uniref:hypothetical protein n=1 Tax=Roseomonas sp. AR75 TaxID=2562311 RepID=UPI0010BFEE57|nr:hypothetical protein [Roseomonas sp. AR75]
MKQYFAVLDAAPRAFAISVAWLIAAQILALLAWGFGLMTRDSALVHWVLLGVLPPAMALARASVPPSR